MASLSQSQRRDQRFCLGMHLQILTLGNTWSKPITSRTLCSLEKNEPKLLAKGSKKVFFKVQEENKHVAKQTKWQFGPAVHPYKPCCWDILPRGISTLIYYTSSIVQEIYNPVPLDSCNIDYLHTSLVTKHLKYYFTMAYSIVETSLVDVDLQKPK